MADMDPVVRLVYYVALQGTSWHLGQDPDAANEYIRIIKEQTAKRHAGLSFSDSTLGAIVEDLIRKYE